MFIYEIYLVLKNIKNTDRTTTIIRTGGALALLGFILGVIPYI